MSAAERLNTVRQIVKIFAIGNSTSENTLGDKVDAPVSCTLNGNDPTRHEHKRSAGDSKNGVACERTLVAQYGKSCKDKESCHGIDGAGGSIGSCNGSGDGDDRSGSTGGSDST